MTTPTPRHLEALSGLYAKIHELEGAVADWEAATTGALQAATQGLHGVLTQIQTGTPTPAGVNVATSAHPLFDSVSGNGTATGPLTEPWVLTDPLADTGSGHR